MNKKTFIMALCMVGHSGYAVEKANLSPSEKKQMTRANLAQETYSDDEEYGISGQANQAPETQKKTEIYETVSEGWSEDDYKAFEQEEKERENERKNERADQVVKLAMESTDLSNTTYEQLVQVLGGAAMKVAELSSMDRAFYDLDEYGRYVQDEYQDTMSEPQRLIEAYKRINPTWVPTNQESA